jgi:hypothetical protein
MARITLFELLLALAGIHNSRMVQVSEETSKVRRRNFEGRTEEVPRF